MQVDHPIHPSGLNRRQKLAGRTVQSNTFRSLSGRLRLNDVWVSRLCRQIHAADVRFGSHSRNLACNIIQAGAAPSIRAGHMGERRPFEVGAKQNHAASYSYDR
jgi:hypothetical protein